MFSDTGGIGSPSPSGSSRAPLFAPQRSDHHPAAKMQQKFDDSNCYLSSGPGTTPFGGLGLSIVSIHPGGILEFESVARQEAGRSFVRQSHAKEVVNLTDYVYHLEIRHQPVQLRFGIPPSRYPSVNHGERNSLRPPKIH
jgi:hypothetical protein